MSLKVKLIIDTLQDKPMEGYIYNKDGYKLRDLFYKFMLHYAELENPDEFKKLREEIDNMFYG